MSQKSVFPNQAWRPEGTWTRSFRSGVGLFRSIQHLLTHLYKYQNIYQQIGIKYMQYVLQVIPYKKMPSIKSVGSGLHCFPNSSPTEPSDAKWMRSFRKGLFIAHWVLRDYPELWKRWPVSYRTLAWASSILGTISNGDLNLVLAKWSKGTSWFVERLR